MTILLSLLLLGLLSNQPGNQPASSVSLSQERQTVSQNKPEVFRRDDEPSEEDRAALRNADEVEIEFTGNRLFLSSLLIQAMPLFNEYMQGEKYDWDRLEVDLVRVCFYLGNQGYLQAMTGTPRIEKTGNRVKVIVPISEGARYRIGKVEVKGAKLFSREKILELCGIKSGDLVPSEVIQHGIYNQISKACREYGYIQASAEFIPDFRLPAPEAEEGIVDVTIEVEEGRQFFISSIAFSENVQEQEPWLLNQILIRSGQVYNERLIELSVVKLNELGLFEEIRMKDVITRTDRETNKVELLIQIREKQ